MVTFKNFAHLLAGIFFGAISCAFVRVAQYKLNGLQPKKACRKAWGLKLGVTLKLGVKLGVIKLGVKSRL
jgi:hypothetical protein